MTQILGPLDRPSLGEQAAGADRGHVVVPEMHHADARPVVDHLEVDLRAGGGIAVARHLSYPQRSIDAVTLEAHRFERGRHMQADLRIGPREQAEALEQPERGDRRQQADRQLPGLAQRPPRRAGDLRQRRRGDRKVFTAELGELDVAGQAPKERHPQERLQNLDLAADGSRRDAQFMRRLGEAQVTARRFERAQRKQWRKFPLHDLRRYSR